MEQDWETPDSQGSLVARAYGVVDPGRPLLEDESGYLQIFQAGSKFFLWDACNNVIYEFVCQDIHEIYHTLHHKGVKALKTIPLEDTGEVEYVGYFPEK